jgi:hypothetical protein
MDKILHISNGGNLTNRLKDLEFKDPVLSWEEMLCEGPTTYKIETRKLFRLRQNFLSKNYDIEIDFKAYKKEIDKLDDPEQYSEIILWFEYDLFCQINMLAVINLLEQRKIKKPIYLVCSGRVKGEKELKGLSELTKNQLLNHYKKRVLLSLEDIELAKTLWGIYCGKDHNLFKPFIVQKSAFEYLGNCLKAHLMRFPDSKTGLGTLEQNVLKLLETHEITSRHHLIGYAINYQGYYGYGDLQYKRVIGNLEPFIDDRDGRIVLNENGKKVLNGETNAMQIINNNVTYGGVKRADFSFDQKENKLIKN